MRLLLKILAGAIALGVLLAAFALVPAHIQIRDVEPELPSLIELRALAALNDGPVRLRYVNTSSQMLPEGELGHTVFLAEWANGNLFMIDTGMDRAEAKEFGKLMETALGAEEAISHGDISELLGADTQRVMGVAYTHLHIDHSQGTIPFCAARGGGRFGLPDCLASGSSQFQHGGGGGDRGRLLSTAWSTWWRYDPDRRGIPRNWIGWSRRSHAWFDSLCDRGEGSSLASVWRCFEQQE